jgi:hypothetical protein
MADKAMKILHRHIMHGKIKKHQKYLVTMMLSYSKDKIAIHAFIRKDPKQKNNLLDDSAKKINLIDGEIIKKMQLLIMHRP